MTAKGILEIAREILEGFRLSAAEVMYALDGIGMSSFRATPEHVDTLFDISLMRPPTVAIPDAPDDTLWTPATRTLSTTEMPDRATRPEAWRIAPGGMPEQLHTGDPGETSVIILSTITWNPGGLYQIWLVAMNSKGASEAGPVQNWTAV